jgi:ribosomal protein S18 acetylase RimI-like enzyme
VATGVAFCGIRLNLCIFFGIFHDHNDMTTDFNAGEEIMFKQATEADANRLTDLIRQYYDYDQIPFDEAEIRSGLNDFLTDPSLGRAWLMVRDLKSVGYIILTFGVDLEVGGRMGWITDLYLEPEYRRKGYGGKALIHVEEFCRTLGLRALELLVERDNVEAQALYKSFGFRAYDRFPMSKRIT